jgi:hypothetical protein
MQLRILTGEQDENNTTFKDIGSTPHLTTPSSTNKATNRFRKLGGTMGSRY